MDFFVTLPVKIVQKELDQYVGATAQQVQASVEFYVLQKVKLALTRFLKSLRTCYNQWETWQTKTSPKLYKAQLESLLILSIPFVEILMVNQDKVVAKVVQHLHLEVKLRLLLLLVDEK